jgi:hypothetical protein
MGGSIIESGLWVLLKIAAVFHGHKIHNRASRFRHLDAIACHLLHRPQMVFAIEAQNRRLPAHHARQLPGKLLRQSKRSEAKDRYAETVFHECPQKEIPGFIAVWKRSGLLRRFIFKAIMIHNRHRVTRACSGPGGAVWTTLPLGLPIRYFSTFFRPCLRLDPQIQEFAGCFAYSDLSLFCEFFQKSALPIGNAV